MRILCLTEFRDAIRKLRKNNSYRDIDEVVGQYFFGKDLVNLREGVRLLNSPDHLPYLKKRLEGKGGYRVYFLIIQKDDDLYLAAIHPKTGSSGQESLPLQEIKAYQALVLKAMEKGDGLEVSYDANTAELSFKPIPKPKKER